MTLKGACNDQHRLDWHLLQLGKHKEALEFAIAAQFLSPSNSELEEKVEDLKKQIAAG